MLGDKRLPGRIGRRGLGQRLKRRQRLHAATFLLQRIGEIEFRARVVAVEAQRLPKSIRRLGVDQALVRHHDGFAQPAQTLHALAANADRLTIGVCGIAGTAVAQIDRRDKIPARTVVRILDEVIFRLRKKQRDVVAGIGKARGQRRIGSPGIAGQEIKADADGGKDQDDEGLCQRMTAAPLRGLGTVRLLARLVGGRQQPAADFGAGVVRLLARDQARGSVAVDLRHLVAIDLDVMAMLAASGCRTTQKRREKGDRQKRGETGDKDPKQHAAQLPEGQWVSN